MADQVSVSSLSTAGLIAQEFWKEPWHEHAVKGMSHSDTVQTHFIATPKTVLVQCEPPSPLLLHSHPREIPFPSHSLPATRLPQPPFSTPQSHPQPQCPKHLNREAPLSSSRASTAAAKQRRPRPSRSDSPPRADRPKRCGFRVCFILSAVSSVGVHTHSTDRPDDRHRADDQ